MLGPLLLVAAGALDAQAQEQPRYPLVGVVFDSLYNQPLAAAVVGIRDAARTAFTDENGRFRFDSLTPGVHRLTVEHDRLDSLGLGAITADAMVHGGADTIRVFTPSFADLWRRACGAPSPPSDSALVFGMVRDAVRGVGVPGAVVQASWTSLSVVDKKPEQSAWGGAVEADASGAYAVCGVPTDAALRIHATVGDARSGTVQLAPSSVRVRRYDLSVALAADSLLRGTVTGTVQDDGGAPVAGARVSVGGADEVETDSTGRFTIRDVPLGTREVLARAVGAEPAVAAVAVGTAEPAMVTIDLLRLTALNAVNVTARSIRRLFVNELDRRKVVGIAKFVDSTAIERLYTLDGALTSIPSLRTTNTGVLYFRRKKSGSPCVPAVMIDKRTADMDELSTYPLTNIGELEVYTYDIQVPAELMSRKRPNLQEDCGTIVVWTKRMFP